MNLLKEYTVEALENELKRRDNLPKKLTWIDPETNLEWQVESNGEMTWDEATDYAKNLKLDGKSDWRLPTRKELFSLVSDDENDLCIKTDKLECVSSSHWSSTTNAGGSSYAWSVTFGYGGVSYDGKGGSYYVRCVRGRR